MNSTYGRHVGVVFMAATNHLSKVDAAIRRAGRFNTVVHLGPPTPDLVPQALRWHLGQALVGENIDRVALTAMGMSGAETGAAVRMAKSAALP